MGLLTQVALILYQNRMSSLEESMFGIKADRKFHQHSIVDFVLSTFHFFLLALNMFNLLVGLFTATLEGNRKCIENSNG